MSFRSMKGVQGMSSVRRPYTELKNNYIKNSMKTSNLLLDPWRSPGPDLKGIFQDLCTIPVLRIRDPKSGDFWPLDQGWVKNQDSDPG